MSILQRICGTRRPIRSSRRADLRTVIFTGVILTGGMGEGSSSGRSCAGACRNCRAARCACRRLAAVPARLTARLIYRRPSFDAVTTRSISSLSCELPGIRHSRFRTIPLVSRRGAMQFWHGPHRRTPRIITRLGDAIEWGAIVGDTDRSRGKRLLPASTAAKLRKSNLIQDRPRPVPRAV